MLDVSSFIITFKVASISTMILLILGVFLAWWLSLCESYFAKFIEILCIIPLLLPPTVLGFYLLIALNQNSLIGGFVYNIFGYSLTFSQLGLVVASIIYSLPFMLQPILNSFRKFPQNLVQQAQILGKSNFTILLKIIIPNSIGGIISGCILSFMHTVGEFGVVLMIGGNIPNRTQMVSMKIYEEVQQANYNTAHLYAIILISLAFISLFLLNIINKKRAY
ncbi:MAG: molybdate ABC transporter permease subunit [Alphaproteobacteria bacterium]|jgi:molybdate transport system permease protein|nr:molybdate ABC transporter permease subunit [Alphaproteobacteria bacterium]